MNTITLDISSANINLALASMISSSPLLASRAAGPRRVGKRAKTAPPLWHDRWRVCPRVHVVSAPNLTRALLGPRGQTRATWCQHLGAMFARLPTLPRLRPGHEAVPFLTMLRAADQRLRAAPNL